MDERIQFDDYFGLHYCLSGIKFFIRYNIDVVTKIKHSSISVKSLMKKYSGSYTLFTVGDNFHKFFVVVPTSIITETDLRDSLQMPNIYVCLNSQHSKAYMNMKYSSWPTLEHYLGIRFSKMLTIWKSWLVDNQGQSVLYGNFFETKHKKDKFMTSTFDSINMTQFLYHTAPPMIILRVKMVSWIWYSGFSLTNMHLSVDSIWEIVQNQKRNWLDLAFVIFTILMKAEVLDFDFNQLLDFDCIYTHNLIRPRSESHSSAWSAVKSHTLCSI